MAKSATGRASDAGANDKGVPLWPAVHEFWDLLFPGEEPAAESVPRWVRSEINGADSNPKDMNAPKRHSTSWSVAPLAESDLDQLSVHLEGSAAVISAAAVEARPKLESLPLRASSAEAIVTPAGHNGREAFAVRSPLFSVGSQHPMYPQWKQQNPFSKLLEGVRSDQWREQATWLSYHAATAVGDRVTAALTESLLEGKLTLFGIASSEPLGNSQPISLDKLRKLRLDVSSNSLTWPDPRRIAFTDVTVGRTVALPPNPSGGQSFDDADAILVVEMRQLIVGEMAESVIAAARMVVDKAMIKLTSATGTVSRKTVSACREDELTPEAITSVVSRLCRDYGAKYHPRGNI